MDLNKLKAALDKDRQRNISILGFIENYPPQSVFQYRSSYAVIGKSDYHWVYLSGSNKYELEELLINIPAHINHFASLEEWMVPIVTNHKRTKWKLSTIRYILPEEIEIQGISKKVKLLDESYAEYIYLNSKYKEFTSLPYIKERIEIGPAIGIIENNQLISWALTHDDNSLGFLHVMPECRNKGYAVNVLKALIYHKRKSLAPVYANIEPHNSSAINLVTKLGFRPDQKIYWLEVSD
jgi:8-oxo-dGTP diphosphatase